MTPEERALVENTLQLAKENNALLHKLDRRARLGTAVKVFYWTVIIALTFGSFYFIQPYVDSMKGVLGSPALQSGPAKDTGYAQQIQDLLK